MWRQFGFISKKMTMKDEEKVDVCDGSYPGHWGGICPWKDRVEVSSFYGLEESFIDQTLSCVDTLVFSSSEVL